MFRITVDSRGLKRLCRNVERLNRTQMAEVGRRVVREIALRLQAHVVLRTPVMTGNLRRNWRLSPMTYSGGVWQADVLNNTEYAPYVEFGHRQTPGRFIPGYWESDRFVYDPNSPTGMTLRRPWVEGRHMLANSVAQVEREVPGYVQRIVEEYLREVLGR